MYNQAAYDTFCNNCRRIAASKHYEFVSITRAARETGLPKGQLAQTARAFGLTVNQTKSGGNGRHGQTADNRGTYQAQA